MSIARSLTKRWTVLFGFTILFAAVALALHSASEAAGRAQEDRSEDKDEKSAQAISRGLEWLSRQQAKDGHWEAGKGLDDVGATGLALLPFLGAGHSHKKAAGEGKDYSKAMQSGLDFLIKKQDRTGSFGSGAVSNALATFALCETYAKTVDPKMKVAAQKGLNALVAAQNRKTGGWAAKAEGPSELSVTVWHLLAVKCGQMAGLNVPKDTVKRVELFLDQCETAQKGSYADSPGGRANPTATATALLCRMYLGIGPRNPGLRGGIDKVIKPNPPGKTSSLDYAFFASQVMHHIGQEDWKAWSMGPDGKSGIRDVLLKRQVAGGKDAGSWVAGKTGLEQAGGRLAATSLALLTLEIPIRGLSLYRRGINVDLPRSKN